jgi:hypothetical protein
VRVSTCETGFRKSSASYARNVGVHVANTFAAGHSYTQSLSLYFQDICLKKENMESVFLFKVTPFPIEHYFF